MLKFRVDLRIMAVSIAVSLVSFRCFDGFVPVVSFRCFEFLYMPEKLRVKGVNPESG